MPVFFTYTDAFYFQLTIRVTDVNDNAPKFELPDYQAHNVDEDIPLGTSILKVKATDADSGSNAEIVYMVSDDHFNVDSSGIITNTKQLDADNNNAYYEFVVTAKDKGLFSLVIICFFSEIKTGMFLRMFQLH
jgi:hypothetical protein